MHRLFVCMLLSIVVAMAAVPAFAADDEYTYTVTLSPGNYGSLSAEGVQVVSTGRSIPQIDASPERIVISNLSLNDYITFDNNVINLPSNSKYYAKGIRITGRDSLTSENMLSSVKVTGDQDYVVAYGLKGNIVDYTVRFVDTDGNQLLPDRAYKGNIGDKPVVAYAYIDGYRPQTHNITGTLKDDASQNVFTFVYTPAPEEGQAQETETEEGVEVVVPAPFSLGGQRAEGADGQAADAGQGTAAGQSADGQSEPAAEGVQEEVVELIDIDESETPLAGEGSDEGHRTLFMLSEQGAMKVIVPLAVAIVVFVAGASLAVSLLLARRKRRKRQEDAAKE